MVLSKEQAATLHPAYRTFLETLWPVLNTSPPGPQIWISAIPFSRVYREMADEYGYDVPQVERVAANLVRAGLVEQDELGFFKPTARGTELMRLLADIEDEALQPVPELPPL